MPYKGNRRSEIERFGEIEVNLTALSPLILNKDHINKFSWINPLDEVILYNKPNNNSSYKVNNNIVIIYVGHNLK